MARPRVGIVGCGNMGRRHARYLIEGTEAVVAAVMDTDDDQVQELAQELSAQPFTDIQELLSHGGIDALFVATPPRIRRKVIVPSAAAGVAVSCRETARYRVGRGPGVSGRHRPGKVLSSVGLMLRYYPLTQRARELLAGRQ